ncbi:MAG: acetate/propionate family kinase [Actinomycetota bacterium]|nr:acetate/propionate family kinase [Actinomycetota bacterium]
MTGVLVVNAGSTSLKLSVVDEAGRSRTLASLGDAPEDVVAVGHRVVHGGAGFRAPVLLDDARLAELRALVDLAPLHNAPALAAIDEARRAFPALPQVAVFDTEFHATLPDEASTYAVPERWRTQWHVRRYGFHGLAVQWASEQVRVDRLVVCHLGGGCSVSAVLRGQSVDTTMGFSPLEGVAMATRAGSLDPAAILYLLRRGGGSPDDIEQALERESGLLGLSGLSAGVEDLERSTEPAAQLALDVYCYRIAGAIGAMAVALGGLAAIVFSGGVGERSALVRARVCARLAFLGVELDEQCNASVTPDADVGARDSRVRVVVLRAREDLVAARAVRSLLDASRPTSPG